MTHFRMWAPNLDRMSLSLSGSTHEMRRAGEHFEIELEARHGDRYTLDVEGAQLPDPRSPHQPSGVHGPSAVDSDTFAWTDEHWNAPPLSSAVLYELHVGTFTEAGTFDAVAGKLEHLRDLGVNAIELMPVAEFPGERGWGYDGVDLYAPHRVYGGPDGLRRLVNTCHERGFAVVLDVVYNHLGPDGNHLPRFAPYFTDRYRTPWGDALNLDGADSEGVRSFLIDNAVRWLETFHIDGLRLDAVHAILDTSAVHLLESLQRRVRAVEATTGRTRWLIAESDLNDPRIVRSPDAGGYGIDAQWSDDFHHALHAVLTGERTGYYADFGKVADIATALRSAFVYDGRYSQFRRRRHGRPATGCSGRQFLAYTQNHDQVGNRALGERSSQLMSPARLRIAAALALLSPFVPMLFQGEEWGATTPFLYFTDHRDPDLARAVSQGRRREFAAFGWPEDAVPDPQDPATYERSKLDWSEPGRGPHAELLAWYRDLLRLRGAEPDLTDGRLDRVEVVSSERPPYLVLRRGRVTLACNLGAEPVQLKPAPVGEVALASAGVPDKHGENVMLPPESATVWLA